MKNVLTTIILFHFSMATAQVGYKLDRTIAVSKNGQVLTLPWTGGLNAAQYNTIDLNGDSREDLVVFDRTADKIYPFLNAAGTFSYAPHYAFSFPKEIHNWMLLRDFNCDGRKDIFTSHRFGIRVFVNATPQQGALTWSTYFSGDDQDYLITKGFTTNINMQMNASDLPAITDVDGDHDLDILLFRPGGASTIEFHKNFSIERDGSCDSLQYERVTQTWGDFQECECGTFAFNGRECVASHGREQHQGGKTLLLLDMDQDGDQDAVVSEENCAHLFYLENEGNAGRAVINSATPVFPNNSDPVNIQSFPAAYYEDIDSDGLKDLIVSPNTSDNMHSTVNYMASNWLYKNSGTAQTPQFTLIQRNFLQDQMIDVGENAAPAFVDYDTDGDQDMVIGRHRAYNLTGKRSTLWLFENTGSSNNPAFELVNNDYLGISALNLYNIKPRFREINGDGRPDLVFSATKSDDSQSNIYYFLNRGGEKVDHAIDPNILFDGIDQDENFEIFDINGDGPPDLLFGKANGSIAYYKNTGGPGSPDFTLEDDTFYGFDGSTSRVNIGITVADINANGTPDMIVGDDVTLTIFEGFLQHLEHPTEGITKLVSHSGIDTPQVFRFGTKLYPAVANLYSERTPALIIGTGQGGIHILKNTHVHPDSDDDIRITLFPNPVIKSNKRQLNITSVTGGSATIRSLLGQRVTHNFHLQPNAPYLLSIDQFSPGLYMVVIIAADNTVSTGKFIVY